MLNKSYLKVIYLLFIVFLFSLCSKKDVEKYQVKQPNNSKGVIKNDVKSLELKNNPSQENSRPESIDGKKIYISEDDPIYKTPIFVEIPRSCLLKNGTDFCKEWKDFIKSYKPFGVILQKSHLQSKQQVKVLIKKIRELGGQDTIIATDREGGRVDRMFWGNPKQWKSYPSPEDMGTLYEQTIKISELPNSNKIKQAVQPNIKQLERQFELIFDEMFKEMKEVGINMTFAPDCDIRAKHSDKFTIGTRSYSEHPSTVIAITKIFVKSAIKNNILVSPKHIPGLGSVFQDTHFNSATIDKTKQQINSVDMKPYLELFKFYGENIHFVLCPHVLYKDIDDRNISTKSAKFTNYIRENTKKDILILSDDLSMSASGVQKDNFEQNIRDIKSDILIAGTGSNLSEVIKIAQIVKNKDNSKFNYFLKRRNN